MENLEMMDVKTLNSMFSKYIKKARVNDPRFSAIKIQRFLTLHRYVQDKFLRGQPITADSLLPILSKINMEYMAASSGIDTENMDAKADVTPIIFKSSDKVILFLSYWAVVRVLMKSVVNKSDMDYLLCIRRSYTPVQRAAIVANIFEVSVSDIAMNGSTFTDDNASAYDALIPSIFGTLAEQVLTAIIKNKKDFQGFYKAF